MITGAQIRARRQQMGLTQKQLGAELNVASNTIARWERDELQPENPRMLELALEQLATERMLAFKGPLGREIKQKFKLLEQTKAELQRLVAEQPSE